MRDIRLLITDSCQYSCPYCPLKAGIGSMNEITEAELYSFCQNIKGERFEISGGEPLLYEGVTGLVRKLKAISPSARVYMTTNGLLLEEKVSDLKDAGIDGINIHLDTVTAETFTSITGCSQVLNQILKGIWKATALDIPVTITSVIGADSLSQTAVMVGMAKQLPITVRLTRAGTYSSTITDAQIMKKIMTSAGVPIREENGFYQPQGWRGGFEFGKGIAGAFHMEDVILFGGRIRP